MIESQRRLAALGLFRRVRITELPRTGSLARDVLVDLEEADTTTIDYGGGLEVSGIGGRADDGSGAADKIDVGAARLLQHQPPQPLGQEPIGHVVRPRHGPAPRAGRRQPRPDRHRRLRVQRLSRAVHIPRAARLWHRRRRASSRPSSSRAGGRASPSTARASPPTTRGDRRVHGDRPLHLRLHQGVR